MTYPLSLLATNDFVTAAQFNALPVGIAKASGAAGSYDFTSIPNMWTHLLIVARLNTGSGNDEDNLILRINNDTTSNYISQQLRGTGSSVAAGGQAFGALGGLQLGRIPGTGSTGGTSSAHLILIANYANASYSPAVVDLSYEWWGTLVGSQAAEVSGGAHLAGVISRVTLVPSAGSFLTGSVATLYGMGSV